MLQWSDMVDWAVKGLLGAVCIQAVRILSQMKVSIDALNKKVATIIERTSWHSKELDKLEKRIERLEA